MLCPESGLQELQYLLFNSAVRWSFSAASLMIKIYAVKTFFLLYTTMDPTSVIPESSSEFELL